ncbi:MAG: hypothetical protein AB8B50_11780 [Pirellulaceae bacterium]
MIQLRLLLRRERFAAALIFLAFLSGMVLTAATSGCDATNRLSASEATASADSSQ